MGPVIEKGIVSLIQQDLSVSELNAAVFLNHFEG